MNKSWHVTHIWTRHRTHPNESWHTSEWVMAYVWMGRVTLVWMSLVAHTNKSCCTYGGVMTTHVSMSPATHIWISLVAHTNESCRTYEWFMSHIYTIHVPRMSCATHVWMSRVAHTNESCPIYKWVMTHVWLSHATDVWIRLVAHRNEPCRTYECEAPFSRRLFLRQSV